MKEGPIKAENRGLLLCPPLAAPPSYSEDFPFNQWYMPYSSTKTPHTSRFPSFSPLLPASTPTDLGGPDSSVTNCHMGSIQGSIVSDQGTSNHAAITVPSLHPLPQAPVRAHVPRPPNAFMLFRSDFLKRGVIPSNVERRQQQLSRVAGQCWNLLPQEEKTIWQQRATEVLTEHQKRNPNYKFTPSPRGSRRSKVIGRSEINKAEGEDRIRKIRETYTQITGPAVRSARRRRPKVHTQSCDIRKTNEHELLFPQIQTSHSVPSSPSSIQQEPPLPPFFPQYSFPHVIAPRRPSTSLGFSLPSVSHKDKPLQSGRSLTRPPSAASSETGLTPILGDLDIVSPIPLSFSANLTKSSDASCLLLSRPFATCYAGLAGCPGLGGNWNCPL